MENLEQIRKEINDIDDKLVKLYIERLEKSKKVAEAKKVTGKPISDLKRENEIVYRLTENLSDRDKLFVKELYATVFSTSKAYQTSILGVQSETEDKIKKIICQGLPEMPVRAAVACQGVEGAYSGSAANKIFPIADVTYFKTFEGVFSAVESGLCEYGVLPVENSTAGSVPEVYDLMKKHDFYIIRAAKIKIEHCLAVCADSTQPIKKVLSHPQALRQCAEYIKGKKYETEEAENTAVAAKRIAEGNEEATAVICSPDCANIYGLKIVERAIQDNNNNYTRFICIGKENEIFSGSDKISVMTALPHSSGSLNRLLMKFSSLGLNLTKIESRPIQGTDFEFMFYFDFEGDITKKEVQSLIADLENDSDKFVFLGSYKEIS